MTTRPQLELPERLVWATNANRTLDPDDTLGSTYPVTKEDGWGDGNRPPARVMNWIHNLQSQWADHVGHATIGNWFANTAVGASTLGAAVFVPDRHMWAMASGTTTYYSDSGTVWSSTGTALLSSIADSAATLQGTGTVVFGTTNGLEYSNTYQFGVWTQVTKATIGITNTIYSMDSKATSDDFLMVVSSTGEVAYSPTGAAGAWSTPTTPPAMGGAGASDKRLVYIEGSTWLLFSRTAASPNSIFISTDDGDTWSLQSTTIPSLGIFRSIAYDPNTERLIMVGTDIGSGPVNFPVIRYSNNLGASTFPAFPIEGRNLAVNTIGKDVYSAGNSFWVVSCDPGNRIFVSSDNGFNWYPADTHGLYSSSTDALHYLAGDGHKIIGVGGSGLNGYCSGPGRTGIIEGG